MWPELLDTIIAAPALRCLSLEFSPWLAETLNTVASPMPLKFPLNRFTYMVPYATKAEGFIMKLSKRPAAMLDIEVRNLRSVLRICHSTLEALTLPAELILLSLDLSFAWDSLRELAIAGYCPDRAAVSLRSIFSCLPNLRIATLHFHPLPESPANDPIFPDGRGGTAFLPHLREFELASLVPHDRILSALPDGLQKLTLIEYPFLHHWNRRPKNILYASEFLTMLTDVYLPAVNHLQLWYRTDSDEAFLHRLPIAFPGLLYLELHRFNGLFFDLGWNFAPILAPVLCEFKHLRVFALEPDTPEFRGERPPHAVDEPHARYIRRLKAVAEEIAAGTQLEEIQMYVSLVQTGFFERWTVSPATGDKVHLHLVDGRKRYRPEIYEILEGFVREIPEDDSDSEPT
ncbi:hypothetical protein K438DRAFT_377098 [Mycena galopus ATCC 62051]|nr:hypothetical protein K438DRAFT_377098 [Mycena galopus ATCC 62051]